MAQKEITRTLFPLRPMCSPEDHFKRSRLLHRCPLRAGKLVVVKTYIEILHPVSTTFTRAAPRVL